VTQESKERTARPIREAANIRLRLRAPEEMRSNIRNVFQGEYESGYYGENLTILDIGANVGAFALWANLRWPNTTIYAYEPQPDTFQLLTLNVRTFANINCRHCAVYPSENRTESFWSRFPGDGEAGLTSYVGKFFTELQRNHIIDVPILHPRELPPADIIKLDVEGGEAAILQAMDIRETSLILLEYHDNENRNASAKLLRDDFFLEYEDSYDWDVMLQGDAEYRTDLAGDRTGKMFFVRRKQTKLTK
jgi:FkbM family methyltransferase